MTLSRFQFAPLIGLRPRTAAAALLPVLIAAAGCGEGPTDPPPSSGCAELAPVSLAAGAHTVVDPTADAGCVRLPGGGASEYLYVALSASGTETQNGVQSSYRIRGGVPATAAPPAARVGPTAAAARAAAEADPARAFHARLRAREGTLRPDAATQERARLSASLTSLVQPPVIGETRTFKVCATDQCTSFVDVPATVKFAAPSGKVAIYLDDTVPANGYTQADIDNVGALFDSYLYPIDTTAFGRESDLDANGVVVVLLTDQVNTLSGACTQTGSIILGYFYGADLIPSQTGSNRGEVFYGLVPDPDNSTCRVSRNFASRLLPPTFVHEFQHMISFNQHVLARDGFSEDTWLNEGLSHYAEELAGRTIPNQFCSPNNQGTPDCFTQFTLSNVDNAYEYLSDVESHFLIEPGSSSGTLEERGANWLFVRWLADHFGSLTPEGTNPTATRALVETNRIGAANVQAVTSGTFPTLVTEWQLANYLDDLAGFTPASPRLSYRSWNFRNTFASLNQQSPSSFPRPYPLVADTALNGNYTRTGTLRGGSGRHVLILQDGGAGAAVDLQVTDSAGAAVLPAATSPRVGLVRIR